jgi:hypothetical protein
MSIDQTFWVSAAHALCCMPLLLRSEVYGRHAQ